MAGEIGCEGLKVSGAGFDSVIRVSQQITQTIIFPEPPLSGTINQNVNESVNIIVT